MRIIKAHERRVNAIAFSPDGRFLASASTDNTVALWDATTGEECWQRRDEALGGFGAVNKLLFAPDGETFLSCGVRLDRFRRWDVRAGLLGPLPPTPGQPAYVGGVGFQAYDEIFVVSSLGDSHDRLLRWSARTWEVLPHLQLGAFFPCLGFSPDGAYLAGLNCYEMRLYSAALLNRLAATANPSLVQAGNPNLAFAPSGESLAIGWGATIVLWSMSHRDTVTQLRVSNKQFQQIAFSPCGRVLAGVSNEEVVTLWDTETWQVRERLAWGIGELKCLAFAPDGTRAAVGGQRGEILIWDLDL